MKVMLRYDKRKPHEVFAIFPEDIADSSGAVTIYDPVCGHGAGDFLWCIQNSRPLKEGFDGYKEILRALEVTGYTDLRIIKRYQRGRK